MLRLNQRSLEAVSQLSAGMGPMVIASVIPWFTVSIWSKVVWADVSSYPPWAREQPV